MLFFKCCDKLFEHSHFYSCKWSISSSPSLSNTSHVDMSAAEDSSIDVEHHQVPQLPKPTIHSNTTDNTNR